VTATYRMYPLYRAQVLLMMSAFAVMAVVLPCLHHGPPGWFTTLWIAGVVWNGYWFLLRVVYRLDLSNDQLEWRTPLRHGTVPLSQLREVRSMRGGGNLAVFVTAGGDSPRALVRRGFSEFTATLQQATPGLQVRLGWQGRLAARRGGPGGGGFRRG
jgi:hypothetical protein